MEGSGILSKPNPAQVPPASTHVMSCTVFDLAFIYYS